MKIANFFSSNFINFTVVPLASGEIEYLNETYWQALLVNFLTPKQEAEYCISF